MTNKEKYKQAFSVLHTSENFSPEVEIMAKLNKKNKIRAIIAACIGIFTIGGLSTTAYAANVGNIQRQIQLWVQGDQTTATLDIDETQGEYKISYTGTDGAPVEISGGGITIDINGNEKPVNEQEIMEHIMMPSVEYLDDGIFELRCKQGSNITRVLYFFYIGKKIIATNGFVKKTQIHQVLKMHS